MSKMLELQFKNSEGKTTTLSSDDPIELVEVASVFTAMDTIIAANILSSKGQNLVAKKVYACLNAML